MFISLRFISELLVKREREKGNTERVPSKEKIKKITWGQANLVPGYGAQSPWTRVDI